MWDLRQNDRFFSLALFWVALAPRLFAAFRWAREPVWDGHYYHFGAQRIAQGLGYSEDVMIGGVAHWRPWCHYPVGYSGFLGGLYKLFGSGLSVAPVANAVVGALTAVLVHRIARHWLTTGRSRLAGCLCAFHPGLVLYTAVVMTEGLAAFTVLLGGWLALSLRRRFQGTWLAGIAFGASALVRPTALVMLPLLFFIWAGTWRRRLTMTALAGVFTLATVAPWTARNCLVMDGCALISTNGGWNLAIGAVTETGRFTTLRAEDGCKDVTGQVDQDKCWGRVGRELIWKDPARWLTLIPRKLAQTYNHESFAVGYLAQARPELWPEARQNAVRSGLTVFHHLLMFAATLAAVSVVFPKTLSAPAFWIQGGLLIVAVGFYAYGLNTYDYPLFWGIVLAPLVAVLPLPGRPSCTGAGCWLWGLVFLTSVTHAIFFGEDRYHLTISPMLCVLAAAALRRAPVFDIGPQTSTASVSHSPSLAKGAFPS